MKLAPNVKKQPRGIKNKDTEVIIFAGSDAWSHAQQWQEKDGPASGDNVPPVWLGPNQLAELDALKIVPDGKKTRKAVPGRRTGFSGESKRLVRSWRRQIFRMRIFTLKECTARSVKTGGAI